MSLGADHGSGAFSIAGSGGRAIGLISGGIDLGESTADLPFESPLFAGLALALVNDVFPAVMAVATLQRRPRALPWLSRGHLTVGVLLVGWIVIRVAFIGLGSWVQVAYFAYGLLIIICAGISGRTTY